MKPSEVNTARLVPCAKAKTHGFHPENEKCPWCEDEPVTAPYYQWDGGTWGYVEGQLVWRGK